MVGEDVPRPVDKREDGRAHGAQVGSQAETASQIHSEERPAHVKQVSMTQTTPAVKNLSRWARDEMADEWEEQWGEKYSEKGPASKWAEKWARQEENVWHERWGKPSSSGGTSICCHKSIRGSPARPLCDSVAPL